MGGLDGRVAVVVGASRGIGKGIALELGAAGAHVVVAGRTLDPPAGHPGGPHDGPSDGPASDGPGGSLSETAAAIVGSGGSAEARRCDFLDEESVARLFSELRSDHGRVDVLVNSAFNARQFGASIGRRFWELPASLWHDVVDVGTRTAYTACVHAAPLLIGSGGGLIVNVSARGAERYLYNVAYGVGKAALDRMTRDMAQELADHRVGVVSLWPNVTATEGLVGSKAARTRAAATFGDLDRLETPRYSGRAVVALASDPEMMARTGQRFWVAELGAAYGFTDENGRTHPWPRSDSPRS